MREFVEDGTVTEFALWDPGALGQLAAYTGAAMASGIITGEEGETFEAGELGEYEIGADGVITLGPPTRFNADNIDDFDF
jgi:rhamnose transport system substrate-binding protein